MDPATIEMWGIETSVGEADAHIRCCVIEPPKFLCGAPYHPECDLDDRPEINCASCRKIRRMYVCEVGHNHCPLLRGGMMVCPAKEGRS